MIQLPKVDKQTNIRIEIGTVIMVLVFSALYAYSGYSEGRNQACLGYGQKLAVHTMNSIRNALSDPGLRHLPSNNEEAGLEPPESYADEWIRTLTVAEGAVIIVEFTGKVMDGNAVMVWIPELDRGRLQTWNCEAFGVSEDYFERWIPPCETHDEPFDHARIVDES